MTVRAVPANDHKEPEFRERLHKFKTLMNEHLKLKIDQASHNDISVPFERVLWDIDDEDREVYADDALDEAPDPFET